ncbi:MAG: nuclear transport factor 2 family protein [Dehalococcoidia bacterium]|nr:nuclear transport factor 2 family protein [Dehalococcoidia bacterium]
MHTHFENIRKLRYKYWRFVREGLVNEIVDLFSENSRVDFGRPTLQAEGKQAVAKLYQTVVGPGAPAGTTFPRGFSPEIEITGDNTAEATWMGEVPKIDAKAQKVTKTGFLYHEEYLREQGLWKISFLKISYTFIEEGKLVTPPGAR